MSKRDKEFSAAYAAVAEKFSHMEDTMTRRDFELIANVLKASRDQLSPGSHTEGETVALNVATLRFANALADTNKAFNRAKFLQAAGYRG